MRREWSLIIVLLFAIIVAVFAVINVEAVEVHYVFGTAQWPLVLVILGSALLGALTVGFAGSVRFLAMKRELRSLRRENQQMKTDSTNKIEQEQPKPKESADTTDSIENTPS